MADAADIRPEGGDGRDALRVQAIAAAMGIIADQGLAALSIRDLAQAIGKSTTVIVNLFQTKAGLLAAVAEAGLEADAAFHVRFLAQTDGAPLDRTTLRALAVGYITRRAGPQARFVRVWEEYLTDREACLAAGPQLRAWAQLQERTWAQLLDRAPAFARLAPVLAPCLVMEGLYASALIGRAEYDLLLGETLDGLMARALDAPPPATPVLDWIEAGLVPPQPPGLEAGSMKLRLLDIAADLIMDGGVGAVTNRSVTQHAKASTSTVLYHFGDMRSFLAQAIWHSVFREIPAYLDWRRPLDHRRPADLTAWSELMAATLEPAPPGAPAAAGFYVKYARLIAQICLLARRDPAFQDLAALLRGPEGGGTYARREAIWPPQFALTRMSAAHFAIWIKGRALLNAIEPPPTEAPHAQLQAAALAIAPRA
ncbi:MAG: TetR family transcriptional regulator [Phenylobacterium sp.]|uniref:TetR family transcriptional regulator n=1 Tax=Phenylobacterium sp. TaxID=1871053 RepID=UPI0025F7818E|nr:TetR family transcriptional regulator [Phenylobacterium sp.]MBA4012151.1 TetR family transcriptional regulator [Phenylobacterium sp.]